MVLNVGDKMKPNRLGFRHFQILLLCLGMMIMYSVKVNMSIAVVSMTDISQSNSFNWTHQTQSIILSSYQWGYVILKIPGGELTSRFGGWIVLTIIVAVNALASVALPSAANWGGWMAVCACRFLQGLASGIQFPVMHYLIGRWVPIDEKSRLGAIIYASGELGTALQLITGGLISSSWGWSSTFYVNGVLCTAWTVVYFFYGASSPQTCKRISPEERSYIHNSLGHTGEQKKVKTPWKSMLTSFPFIILIIVTTGQTWGYWFLLAEIPTYMKNILGFDTKANGFVSSAPYFGTFVMSFVLSAIADYLLSNKILTVTTCRKIISLTCTFGSSIFLIALSYTHGNAVTSVILLTISNSLQSGHYSSINLGSLDLAPNHAATMVGITSFVGNCVSLMAPLAVGFIIEDETSPSEWRKVIFLTAGIISISEFLYLVFGSNRRQKWNDPEYDNNKKKYPEKQDELHNVPSA